MSDTAIVFTVNGNEIVVDPRTLTFSERQALRKKMAELHDADELDYTVGALWVTMRRTDPNLTYESIADTVVIGDVMDAKKAAAPAGGDGDPS